MRMLLGRVGLEKDGFQFNLDDARPMGPQHIIRAARDPVARVPTDELITALLQRTLCRAKLDEENKAWSISSVNGKTVAISLGATIGVWIDTCEKLLEEAMSDDQ